MQQRFWRNQYLGMLAGLAVLSLSAASLRAQDTASAGQARMDTSQTYSSTQYDSTRYDSTRHDSTMQSDSLRQNPPGYRGMEEDTSSASGDTSSAASSGQTTSGLNDSTWRDSAGLNRDRGADPPRRSTGARVTEVTPSDSGASDTSKMGP